METTIIKSTEDARPIKNIQSEMKLFGWELKSNEKANEMVGVNQFEEYKKYTFERDEKAPKYQQLVDHENSYNALKERIVKLTEELERKKNLNIGEEPVWARTKSRDFGTYTYTETKYYNNYVPMNGLLVVGIFSPLLPICLPYTIIKCVQKSKAKKLLAKDRAKYFEKLKDKQNQISEVKNEIDAAKRKMDEIITSLNSL